jgi:hypothetical protein
LRRYVVEPNRLELSARPAVTDLNPVEDTVAHRLAHADAHPLAHTDTHKIAHTDADRKPVNEPVADDFTHAVADRKPLANSITDAVARLRSVDCLAMDPPPQTFRGL